MNIRHPDPDITSAATLQQSLRTAALLAFLAFSLTAPAVAQAEATSFLPMVGIERPAFVMMGDPVDSENYFVFSIVAERAQVVLTNPHSDGRQLGDLRVGTVDFRFVSGAHAGDVTATLLTTGLDSPEPGDEVRMVTLAFRFGNGVDQIVVQGATTFFGAEPTIGRDQSTIRPITGGSGRFAGAGGWSETVHLEDGTWENIFHVILPERDEDEDDDDDSDDDDSDDDDSDEDEQDD